MGLIYFLSMFSVSLAPRLCEGVAVLHISSASFQRHTELVCFVFNLKPMVGMC